MTPAQKEREGWAGPGNTSEAKEIHLRIWRLQGLQGALLSAGAPGEEGSPLAVGQGCDVQLTFRPARHVQIWQGWWSGTQVSKN